MPNLIDWKIFQVIHSDTTTAFEQLCEEVFRRECNIVEPIEHFFNYAGIETKAVRGIGFQAKFFEALTSVSYDHYRQIAKSIQNAIDRKISGEYELTKIYIFSHLVWADNPLKDTIHQNAEQAGIELVWYNDWNRLFSLPDGQDIINRYFTDKTEETLNEHTKILKSIQESFKKPDDKYLIDIIDNIANDLIYSYRLDEFAVLRDALIPLVEGSNVEVRFKFYLLNVRFFGNIHNEEEVVKWLKKASDVNYGPEYSQTVKIYIEWLDKKISDEQAITSLDEILKSNPKVLPAYNYKIVIEGKSGNFEEIYKNIPTHIASNEAINMTLGLIAMQQGIEDKAISIFEEIMKKNPKKTLYCVSKIADIKLSKFEKNKKIEKGTYLLTAEDKKELIWLQSVYSELWDNIYGSKFKSIFIYRLMNNALVNFSLGEKDKALQIFDLIINSGQKRGIGKKELTTTHTNQIWMALISGKPAEEVLGMIKEDLSDVQTTLIAARTYAQIGNIEKAEKILLALNPENEEDTHKVKYTLLEFYLRTAGYETLAKSMLDEMINSTSIKDKITLLACISEGDIVKMGIKIDVDGLVKNIISQIDTLPLWELYYTGEMLLTLNYNKEAYKIYEKLFPLNNNLDTLKNIIKAGERNDIEASKLISFCDDYIKVYGIDKDVLIMKTEIYQNIRDYKNAIINCENLVKLTNDPNSLLRLNHLKYLTQDEKRLKEVDKYCQESDEYGKIYRSNIRTYAEILISLGYGEKALKMAYEYLCDNVSEQDAYNLYMMVINNDKQGKLSFILHQNTIAEGVYFELEENGSTARYIIQSDIVGLPGVEILKTSDNLYSLIKDAKEGDEIALSGTRKGKVKNIKSKFLYAYHYVLSSSEIKFGDKSAVKMLTIDENDENSIKNMLEQMNATADANYEQGQELLKLYNEGKITLSFLAENRNMNIVEAYYAITSLGGIRVLGGVQKDLLKIGSVVIDITAIITLHKLGLLECFNKLPISKVVLQSTLDKLNGDILEEKHLGGKHISFYKTGEGQYAQHEHTEEEYKQKQQVLLEIKQFIENACELSPMVSSIIVKNERLKEILGVEYLDVMMYAQQTGAYFYADDEVLSLIALQEFKVQSTSINTIITLLFEHSIITKEKHDECLALLIMENYKNTLYSVDVIINILNQERYSHEEIISKFKFFKNYEAAISVFTALIINVNVSKNLAKYLDFFVLFLSKIEFPFSEKSIIKSAIREAISKVPLAETLKEDVETILKKWD